jgi:hypothetical protein
MNNLIKMERKQEFGEWVKKSFYGLFAKPKRLQKAHKCN